MLESERDAMAQRYALLETSELLRILGVDSEGYEPEALRLAKAELRQRELSKDSFQQAVQDLEEDLEEEKEHEFGHLSVAGRIACFLVLPSYIITKWLRLSGRIQASRDARRWSLYGLLFWVSFGFLLFEVLA